jgi:hypothetical protein
MSYDIYYHPIKFELKDQLLWDKQKRQILLRYRLDQVKDL